MAVSATVTAEAAATTSNSFVAVMVLCVCACARACLRDCACAGIPEAVAWREGWREARPLLNTSRGRPYAAVGSVAVVCVRGWRRRWAAGGNADTASDSAARQGAAGELI